MNFFKRCSKSGRLYLKSKKDIKTYLLPIWGLIALIWVVIRVLPKPTRASYPCMKVAMPLASGFIAYIIGILLTAWIFVKSHKYFRTANYWAASFLFIIGLGLTIMLQGSNETAEASFKTFTPPVHQPMGEAKGIFPGRVVWVHNPDATNENCTLSQNRDGAADENDDTWFSKKNNNQAVIDKMLSDGMQYLTGKSGSFDAWTAVFKYYNKNKGKGEVSYQPGEKIYIKINATSCWSGNFNTGDLSKVDKASNQYFHISETSPFVVLSVLRQLVNVVGVPKENIYVGEPMKHIYKHLYDIWHPEFPNIHYLDHDGYITLGREKAEASKKVSIKYSDKGSILRTNVWSGNSGDDPVYDDCVYKIIEDADYMINIPMMKGHKRAGMTMFAKNHYGSHTRGDASHLHNGLVAPTEMESGVTRGGYGLYRVLVDLMGNEFLGGKNLIYIMDALWSTDHELGTPRKFQSQPFNNDWSSSIFLSLDPVAVESVGYDFLRNEFTSERDNTDGSVTYVQMEGTEDYLHQCADSSNWPDGIIYDPEGDGTILTSLGVHDHWNNPTDKQYSGNLGLENGIELIQVTLPTSVEVGGKLADLTYKLLSNYPNPFNPTTTINYEIPQNSNVNINIYDLRGNKVANVINEFKQAGRHSIRFNGTNLSSGVYFYELNAGNYKAAKKFVLLK